MRLFVAIQIPAGVRAALAAFLKELRGIAPLAKWVRAENLHLTLKFLGETDSSRLGAISKSLCSVRSPRPVDAAVSGLGFFPEDRRSRVFWAGLEASPNLKTLAADIDHA
ncbi:MAG TPA: RNA 2',3'-cyclic phosphodiesterase, partial [Candidatus Acidoferrum sp.]